MDRRQFVFSSLALASDNALPKTEPRFAHRQAQMVTAPGKSVFELAAKIPGLSGVQLQVIWKGNDLGENGLAADYKQQARSYGIQTPSIAGIWRPGENILQPQVAERAIANAIRVAATLDARVILVVMFNENCPKMTDEAAYGPVVSLLLRMAPQAADRNVKLCLETSLLPIEDRKLVDLVAHPNVRVYYDAHNVENFHPGEALVGIPLLNARIAEVHLKNENRLLNQQPSNLNWAAAIHAYRDTHYSGWFCFETEHASPDRCIADTLANIAFVRENIRF